MNRRQLLSHFGNWKKKAGNFGNRLRFFHFFTLNFCHLLNFCHVFNSDSVTSKDARPTIHTHTQRERARQGHTIFHPQVNGGLEHYFVQVSAFLLHLDPRYACLSALDTELQLLAACDHKFRSIERENACIGTPRPFTAANQAHAPAHWMYVPIPPMKHERPTPRGAAPSAWCPPSSPRSISSLAA
jgi:hypothetical protein